MILLKTIYDKIINNCSTALVETGGIIGGKRNIITHFILDGENELNSTQHYYPNIDNLNSCIKIWQNEGILFYGIVHSHFHEDKELSFGDKQYIQKIMQAMPREIKFLYFPIVLPQNELVSFKAVRMKDNINIIYDDITIN